MTQNKGIKYKYVKIEASRKHAGNAESKEREADSPNDAFDKIEINLYLGESTTAPAFNDFPFAPRINI